MLKTQLSSKEYCSIYMVVRLFLSCLIIQAAESLKGMLDRAKSSIPQSMWSKTPLALKATAGLRLLPTERAAALLNKVIKTQSKITGQTIFMHLLCKKRHVAFAFCDRPVRI